MFSTFFNRAPLIDQDSKEWILATSAWAITHFNSDWFYQHTQLVLPDNNFYPGRVNSAQQMADTMFNHTLKYAGMENWPIKLAHINQVNYLQPSNLLVNHELRGENALVEMQPAGSFVQLGYFEQQLNQPQDLIAILVQQLATLLINHQTVLPPGGKDCLAPAVEVLAAMMGFGVIFANTAYQFRGGCGSCNNASLNRKSSLPENEVLYCVAVFATLKNISIKQITPQLKKHLRSPFKQMMKTLPQELENSVDLFN